MNCLLVIDMQKGFINHSTEHLINDISKYLDNNKYDHIIFTKFINKDNSIFTKQLDWFRLINNQEQEIVLKTDNYIIIEKEKLSAVNNQFFDYIKKNSIDEFFLCGVDTDSCVLKTAFDLFELGYDLKVLKNLCASSGGKEYHEMGLKILERNIGSKNIV